MILPRASEASRHRNVGIGRDPSAHLNSPVCNDPRWGSKTKTPLLTFERKDCSRVVKATTIRTLV